MDSDIAKVKYKVDESHKKDKTKCSAQEKWVDGQRKNLYTKSSWLSLAQQRENNWLLWAASLRQIDEEYTWWWGRNRTEFTQKR